MYGSLEAIDAAYRTHAMGEAPAEAVSVTVVEEVEEVDESEVTITDIDPPAERYPAEDWLKTEIQEWMDERSIPYSSGDTKAELLEIVQQRA